MDAAHALPQAAYKGQQVQVSQYTRAGVISLAQAVAVCTPCWAGGVLSLLLRLPDTPPSLCHPFTASAGNQGRSMMTSSPANCPSALAVTSVSDYDGMPGALSTPANETDLDDTFTDFSNWGNNDTAARTIAGPGESRVQALCMWTAACSTDCCMWRGQFLRIYRQIYRQGGRGGSLAQPRWLHQQLAIVASAPSLCWGQRVGEVAQRLCSAVRVTVSHLTC